MSLTRADPHTLTLSTDPGRMAVRCVISTIDADRSGDVVVPTGVKNVEEYMLNPVVLWAHDRFRVPPIGTCAWIDVQPRRIVAETRFAEGISFAEDVFKLYDRGVLRGWSIGFVPRKAYRRGSHPSGSSLYVQEWDLLEYSAVPIPENPGAVTVALEKGLVTDPDLVEWLSQIPDDRGRRVWKAFPDPDDAFEPLVATKA
ncbi:MAG: HK97 family phage prohead protease [Gemmataceae bacterium]